MQDFTLSLDVWNTLVVYNPDVKHTRLQALRHLTGVDVTTIDRVYTQMKRSADEFAEGGGCHSQKDIYTTFIESLGLDSRKVSWEAVRHAVECAFKKHPPFFQHNLADTLSGFKKRMRDKYGCVAHIGIASNNNFISGEVIYDTVLRHLNTEFAFHVSSVDVGCAKPSNKFIDVVVERSPTKKIIHIGDNPICDNFGSRIYRSIIINNPIHCISVINDMKVA